MLTAALCKISGAVLSPEQKQSVHAAVRSYQLDQLMSIANAIAPTKPEEVQIVAWLQTEIVKIAKQLPETAEKTNG